MIGGDVSDTRSNCGSNLWGAGARQVRGTDAARQALQPSRQGAASSFHQWRLLLVGVSAPAVPPMIAPAPAPRPPPRIAPAAAPPPAPMPTFLARLRLPLLLLLLFLLEVVRLLEVAAIRGTAVSASSPKHRAAAHSDFFIDRPSRNKICNQSAKLRGVCNGFGSMSLGTLPAIGQAVNVPLDGPVCTVLVHVDHPKLNAPRGRWLHRSKWRHFRRESPLFRYSSRTLLRRSLRLSRIPNRKVSCCLTELKQS